MCRKVKIDALYFDSIWRNFYFPSCECRRQHPIEELLSLGLAILLQTPRCYTAPILIIDKVER